MDDIWNCLTEEQIIHIKSFGVPVDSWNPGTYFIVSIPYETQMPTDAEIRMIKSFGEYKVRNFFYNDRLQREILAKEFPADAGHNTQTFLKGGRHEHSKFPTEGWGFRRISWTQGPQFFPTRYQNDDFEPWDLLTLLDYLEADYNKGCFRGTKYKNRGSAKTEAAWDRWKAEHADIFGAEAA